MKTLIAVPCMDMVAAGFAQSLACLTKVGECSVAFQVGSLIYDARNNLAKKALEIDADYVLWLDSDMIFAPDTMERLLEDIREKDCDIVTGLYFRRKYPYTPVLFKELAKPDENRTLHFQNYDKYPEDSLFEIAGAGGGCLMHKAEILFESFAAYKTCFDPMGGYGEDLSFCLRAKELGYKVWCDSTIKCGHVGQTVVDERFYHQIGGGK